MYNNNNNKKIPIFKDYSKKNFREELDENGKWKRLVNNNNIQEKNLQNNILIDLSDKNINDKSIFNNKKEEFNNNINIINNINSNNSENILPINDTNINNLNHNLNNNHINHQPSLNKQLNIKKGLPMPECFRNGNYSYVENILFLKFNIDENNNLDEKSIYNFYIENKNDHNDNEKIDLTKVFDNIMFNNHLDYLKYFGCVSNALNSKIFKTNDGIKYVFYTRHCFPFRYLDKLSIKYPNINFYFKSKDLTNNLYYEEVIFQNGIKYNL